MASNREVLFVCLGNICRSPTGEGVFRKFVEDRGLNRQIQIDSAGTIGYHSGSRADARMRKAASRRGYDLTSRARQVQYDDFERFDLVIAMDRSNLSDLQALDSGSKYSDKICLLGDFLADEGRPDVPDPYYGGPQGFETVLDMIERACPAIIDRLLSDR